MQPRIQNIIHNRKARHDYHLMEHFEAGIALKGSEVKSLRNGQGSLDEAFVSFKSTGAWLHGFHIAPYSHANINNQWCTEHSRDGGCPFPCDVTGCSRRSAREARSRLRARAGVTGSDGGAG